MIFGARRPCPGRVLVLASLLVVAACSANPRSKNQSRPTPVTPRRVEPIYFSYRSGYVISEAPPYWSLELHRRGTARLNALTEGLPKGSFAGEVSSDLTSAIVAEVDRLERAEDTPICGGHAATFEVVELQKAFYRNDCLPLRTASGLETLYGLVQEALQTTKWMPSPDPDVPVVNVNDVVRRSEVFLGRSVVLRAAFLDQGSKGWVLSDALLPVPVTLAAEFASAQAAARARQYLPDLLAEPHPRFPRLRAVCVLGVPQRRTAEGDLTFSIKDVAPYTNAQPCFPKKDGG